MQAHTHGLSVAMAHGGPLTNQFLEQMLPAMRAAQHDNPPLTDEMGCVMLLTWPQLAEEVLRRRRLMAVIADCAGENVVCFPGTSEGRA